MAKRNGRAGQVVEDQQTQQTQGSDTTVENSNANESETKPVKLNLRTIVNNNIPWTIRKLAKNEKLLRFDLAIQRNSVWKDEQKSLFIHTLITGYPFPPVYALDEGDDQLWFLDGKQRLTTTLSFVNDGFKLHDDTPSIECYDDEDNLVEVVIGGKYFTDLPEEFREEIMSVNFNIVQLKGLTEAQRDEMFYRLNNGAPLKSIELTRVLASSAVMSFIQELNERPFFKDSVALTEKGRNRFVDEEMVMQIIALVEANRQAVTNGEALRAIDIGGKSMKDFAKDKAIAGIGDDVKEITEQVAEYLAKAFPVYDKDLKKIHVPMLFLMAWKYAIPQGIEPIKFAGWSQYFFKSQKRGSKYNNASSAGSAKEENVRKRLEAMSSHYTSHIEEAEDYKIPEPKTVSGRRNKSDIENAVDQSDKAMQEAAASQKEHTQDIQDNPMWQEGQSGSDSLQVNLSSDIVDNLSSDIVNSDEKTDEVVGANPAEVGTADVPQA